MIRTIRLSITLFAAILSAFGTARAGDPVLPSAKDAHAAEELKRTIEEMRDDVRELRRDVANLRQLLESGDTSSAAERKMFADLVEQYNQLVKHDRWAEAELIAIQAKDLARGEHMTRAAVATIMYEKARVGRQVARNAQLSGAAARGEQVDLLDAVQPDVLRLHFSLPQGMTWPTGVLPEIYSEAMRDKAQLTWQPMNRRVGRPDPYSAGIRSIAPDTFAVRLSHPEEPFYVAVFAPGILRFFERGAFKLSEIKNGVLEIAIEKPGILDVRFDARNRKPQDRPLQIVSEKPHMYELRLNPGYKKPADLPFDRQWVTVWRKKPGPPDSRLWVCQHLEMPQGKLQITDLAAGNYLVTVGTRAKPSVKPIDKPTQTPLNPGEFRDYKEPTLLAGETSRIDSHYVPLDLEAYRGKRTAVVRISKPDGKPATGSRVSIGYFDGHYGRLPVFFGPLPASGEIILRDITDGVLDNSWALHGYSVWVDQREIGKFEFQTKSAPETFTFQIPPDVGDLAPDIELVSAATGKHTRLSSLRGKPVCLDFWLTWCEYCQEPMRSLDRAAADRWKDRITIVPVSFDAKCASVAPFVNERGGNHLQHYWAGPWQLGPLDTPAARAFVCDAIPVTILIGPDGRILWRGHPLAKVSGKDIADRIDAMLKSSAHAEKSAKPSGAAAVQ